ncbi:phosphatidylinositol-specific phospholipase C domain-containing protein [Streptomyces sp. FXJ1.172]|uniref:phosphatidylinositol-specific phospholipase C domain-containing protein n=1 Tax=Streptomyces sp. FXJ1.172 TaxID=710705 RepID=UPI0007CF17A3|nr:phosphatidylinositol-specific phospholipase C domain-containing protein [Streptomyces sp. FXJ1.172]WEO95194.1 phosphatidylinositol-specific phospholipase C domain-containing protein [Streptomyces sp. FXJ1.172]
MRVMRRLAALVGAAALLAVVPGNAHAASAKFSETTAIGTHNAYDKSKYTYFAQALDSGASLLEIDIYADSLNKRWRVSHSNPIGNDNNCEDAKTPGELYSKDRNQDFGSCLDNIAAWNQLHPDHPPIVFKTEMKAGFNNDAGLGPDEFDTLISQKLGSSVYKPSDLLGSSYSTLDAAAKANAWPGRDSLRGKFVFEVIPGTVEMNNPFDHYWTDQEYGDHLRDLYAAGNIARAEAFPAVLGAAGGDPRASRWTSDTSIRPWFVFFDGDAATYVNNGYDTSFYSANHYILIMTDAYAVSPAISSTAPTDAEVAARLALLAGDHASIITSDWSSKPASVLSSVVTRS